MDNHKIYRRQDEQRKIVNNIPNEVMYMDSRIGIQKSSKKKLITKNYIEDIRYR